MVWGKIVGTTLGTLVAGPIGAGLGIAAGEFIDKFMEEESRSGATQKGNKIRIKLKKEV